MISDLKSYQDMLMNSGAGGMAAFPLSRRSFVESGAVAAAASLATPWLRADQSLADSPRAKSVIMIFNSGAPSHIDLCDMKPEAGDNIRGIFQPIATQTPGIMISELMPNLVRHTNKLAILRTLHHTHSGHNSGMYWSIVGKPYSRDDTLMNPSRTDFPSFGTLTGWLAQRDGYSGALPPYVITPRPHCDSLVYITPGQFGACLGPKYDPFVLYADPNAADFKAPNIGLADGMNVERLRTRQALLGRFEQAQTPISHAQVGEIDVNITKAMSLASSESAAAAFDLTKEPDAVREKYGRHQWGQSHLLARRLIEAGVPFVSTVNGPSINWDTHQNNFNLLKHTLVPPMERAYAALLDDLSERGLLDTTLVAWMGDFGRTPIINNQAGRDHWPQCYTMVLAGGGIRGGQYVGKSDKTGTYPAERPLIPADVHATIFTALGYDPHGITYQTTDGRPMPLSEGEPIREVL
jgi:hypothetical protein